MSYCSQCGVEVGAGIERCPLCNAPIQRLAKPPAEAQRYPDVAQIPGRHVRYFVWSLSTASLLSAALLFVTLDTILNHEISWSRYPLTGIGVLWLFITLVVILARRPIFVIAGQAVATAGFLVLIDLFDGGLDWFVSLALPIVAVVTGASVFVWLVTRLSHRAPAMIAASALFCSAAGSIGLDLLISPHLGAMGLSWSLIVVGAVVPLMVFLLYFHFRLGRRIDLSRILHT